MSGWRAAWVLGTFGCVFVVTVLVGAVEDVGSDARLVATGLALASLYPLAAVHELGHAAAAIAVGYRVTGIRLTDLGDALTEVERPPHRDTPGREAVFLLGGPAVTLVAVGLLLVIPMDGFLAAWRAGAATFGVLWTADVLAPLDRPWGVERDGFVLARLWRERRQHRGMLSDADAAIVQPIDELIIAGQLHQARLLINDHIELLTEERLALWGALLARAALLELLAHEVRPTGPGSPADQYSADAVRLCPLDPVCVGVRRRFEQHNGSELAVPSDVRPPTEEERRLLDAWT